MSTVRQIAFITQTVVRPSAKTHVRRLSSSATSGGPPTSSAGRCRCWPNPPCHHHATGACGYSQFECGGGTGGCSPAEYHQAAASGVSLAASSSSSFQATTTNMLAGATQTVGLQCKTLLNGILFDSERTAGATATMVMAGGGGKGGEEVSFSR